MELALAYQCEEKIGMKRLLQYIHYNRETNALTINAMGECLHNAEVNKPFLSTGDTLEVLKTEIEDDLGKNITKQEERITTNSDLIRTVTNGVAKNEVDMRGFETKLNRQKKETTDLINGVFSNLSGVLAGAVQNVVKANAA